MGRADEAYGKASRRIADAARKQSKSLDLSGLGLTEVPESIANLTALTSLDLYGNRLTALPETIANLTTLTYLNLRGNQLTTLPETIGNLTALTFLKLGGNRLTALPESIGNLTALTHLGLDYNEHLSSPPPEVVAQGTDAVLTFLRALSESSVERWQSKVLVVGEATVGKTSLTKQLFGKAFDPDERQTHGVRVQALRVPHPDRLDVTMALDVWDFGGQLEYRATQRFYLTDRSLFLLVWNSRARWADGKVIAWLDAIGARAPGSPILMVATHGDEGSPAALPRDLRDRYPRIVGDITIDSRTGLGIGDLRTAVRRHAADLPLMGSGWPTTWDAAARALGEEPGLTITTSSAFRLMEEAGVHDPDAQERIARILHDLGQIAYFADYHGLNGKIILKPEWLDGAITKVIDSREVGARGGVLSRAERNRLWGDLAVAEDDPDLPSRLLRMMEAFDLAYRTGDADDSKDVAIVVDRLEEARPAGTDERWEEVRDAAGTREIGIIYKLSSRQAGIPTWFIAREHRYTTEYHWRYGTLLADLDPDTPAWALLTDDGREQPTITLRVAGAYPVRFFSVLTEAFDTIVKDRYPGLVEDRLVPCACRAADGGNCGHAFPLKQLILEATDADPSADHKVRCLESGRKVEAALMLDGLHGTGLTRELDAIRDTVDGLYDSQQAMSSTLSAVDSRQQTVLNGIRALLEHRANAGAHCPSLLTISEDTSAGPLRRTKITVRLWCESPSGPHPLEGENGCYTVTKVPDALADYLPYLRYLITVLGLAAPALGSVGVALSDQAKDQIDAAARTLAFIEKHASTAARVAERGSRSPDGRAMRPESGADFRALRDMLLRLDPGNEWGGLSPVIRPEDNGTMYLCPLHTREYDYPYAQEAELENAN